MVPSIKCCNLFLSICLFLVFTSGFNPQSSSSFYTRFGKAVPLHTVVGLRELFVKGNVSYGFLIFFNQVWTEKISDLFHDSRCHCLDRRSVVYDV